MLTVERLNAFDIICRQNKCLWVSVAVRRVHERTGVVGVRQAQRVTKLMGSHQEQNKS